MASRTEAIRASAISGDLVGERFIAGPYGVAHHYDGSNYCFLVTRSGQQTTTNHSGIRPFHVNLALGQAGMGRRPCGQGRAACRQPHAVRPVQRCRAGRLLQPGAVVAFRGSVGRARTAATYGLHLQWTDTNLYQNIHCVGGNANSACFLFDYAVQDDLPSACTILGIDPGGNGTTSRQFVNNGVPGPGARPNCLKGLGEIRGRQPSIANLRPDLPQIVTALDLAGPSRQTQPITNSPLFTPCEDGLHRTSVYLRVNRGAGSGTFIARITAFDGAGALNLDLNPPASAAGGYPVNYSVVFQNTSAVPAYSLTMSTERIG